MPRPLRKTFFSNLDALKEILGKESPLPLKEIISRIQKKYLPDESEEEIRNYFVLPVLNGQNFFNHLENEEWSLDYKKLPEHQCALKILRAEGKVIPSRVLRERIAESLRLPLKRVFFFPEKDPETFKKFSFPLKVEEGECWVPRDWRLINDEAVEILKREKTPLNTREIEEKVRAHYKLTEPILIFEPRWDDRFEAHKRKWVLREEREAVIEKKATSWVVEVTLKEKVIQALEEVLERMKHRPQPFSLNDLTQSLLGKEAQSVKDTLYFSLLKECLQAKEAQGKLVRVRGHRETFSLRAAWRLSETIPPAVFTLPIREESFEPKPFEILSDRGLDPEMVAILKNPYDYFYDGDYEEHQFPPSGFCIFITYHEMLTGIVALSAPGKAFLKKELGLFFEGSSGERPHSPETGPVAEVEVRIPDGTNLNIFIHLGTGLVFGLEDFISRYSEPGACYRVEVTGSYQLTLTPEVTPTLSEIPIITGEEIERLDEMIPLLPELSLFQVVVEILSQYKEGLTVMDLYHRVQYLRRTSRRHLFSLLCQHYAFQKKDQKWKIMPERLAWEKKKSLLVHAREFLASQSFSFSFAGPKIPLREKEDGWTLTLRGIKTLPRPRDYILLFSRHDSAYVGSFFASAVHRINDAEVIIETPALELWEVKVPLEKDWKVGLERTSLYPLRTTMLSKLLETFDRLSYAYWVKKTLTRSFRFVEMTPALTQKSKDEIQELKGYLEEEQSPFLALKGISWQLQMTPTYEEFNKILEEKHYSRGERTRLKPWEMQEAVLSLELSFPQRLLFFPLGEGEWALSILEDFKKQLIEGGYGVEEEGVKFFLAGQEEILPWEKIVSDRRRVEKIRMREDDLNTDEALNALLERYTLGVEPRRSLFLIASLSLRFKGFGSLPLMNKRVEDFLRDSPGPDEVERNGFDRIIGDLRNLSHKEVRSILTGIPSFLRTGGLASFFIHTDVKGLAVDSEKVLSDAVKLVFLRR